MAHTTSTWMPSRAQWPAEVPAPVRADDEPLVLPEPPPAARRTQLPVLASAVPVAGAVGLWAVTGSVFSLWFALLGPLIAVATLLDGRRSARRDRRRASRDAAAARTRLEGEIERRHGRERARRWMLHPDAASLAIDESRIWRAPVGGIDLVVGRGAADSTLRVTGGGGGPQARALKVHAATLEGAPITAALSGGIAVTGPPVLAAAVVRALVVQACLLVPPDGLRVVGTATGEWAWSAALPHRRSGSGPTLLLAARGDTTPADAVIARVDPDAAPPPRCTAVLDVRTPTRATLTVGATSVGVTVEALGVGQAAQLATDLAERARAVFPDPVAAPTVRFADLVQQDRPTPGTLAAVIGASDGAPVAVDLVADGPHAVVAGMTGSGKSELLITWVASMCATHPTSHVNFLLADFKGGTAFDALRALPHVTGVITDLDGSGASRALDSLSAEVRRREAELARVGARDIGDPRVAMARLVIVVDEFAALLSDHRELQPIFTDVAARGRALGMHLILGTQRVSGVVREALLANCPLRVSLRVTDTADSRAVIGTDEAARLPGGTVSRGAALLRRAGDAAPRPLRVALTEPSDIAAVVQASRSQPEPWRPWLPELPRRVAVDALVAAASPQPGELVLGLADEPDRQRQHPVTLRPSERGLLVVGMAGSGRTTALAAIARQVPEGFLRWVPRDPEAAWDAIARLEYPPAAGSVVIVDDLDALLARFPLDHAHVATERLERLARMAGDTGIRVIVSTQRATGAAARIGDLLPLRAVLAMPSRADVVAAGGDGTLWMPGAPPGRAALGGRHVQLACGAALPVPTGADAAPQWSARRGVTGVVAGRGTAAALGEALRAAGVTVIAVDDAVAVVESSRAFDAPVAVLGDCDAWQRGWRVLTAVRAEHDLVIDAACAADYRALSGDREPPPYCAPRPGRAWLLAAGDQPRRIRLPVDRDTRAIEST